MQFLVFSISALAKPLSFFSLSFRFRYYWSTDAHFSRVSDGPHHASKGAQAEASAPPPVAASLLAKPGTLMRELPAYIQAWSTVCCRQAKIALPMYHQMNFSPYAIRPLFLARSVCCAARVEGSHLQHLPAHRDPSRYRCRSVQARVQGSHDSFGKGDHKRKPELHALNGIGRKQVFGFSSNLDPLRGQSVLTFV